MVLVLVLKLSETKFNEQREVVELRTPSYSSFQLTLRSLTTSRYSLNWSHVGEFFILHYFIFLSLENKLLH